MSTRHTNKTLATFLAAILGGIGAHRFYLHGMHDRFAWLHLISVPLSLSALQLWPQQQAFFMLMPLLLSILAGLITALVLGLTPDEKWDARYNAQSGKASNSGWIVILLVIFSLTIGATGIISLMARGFDLLYTGGAYG